MSPGVHQFLSIDALPLFAAVLSGFTCALLGTFLVLRRLSLMGDAISHSVLPGLVAGFLISGSREPLPMFLGAAGAGLLTVLLVGAVKRFGRVEPGAAMGVVFSVMFALGVLLIETNAARQVDLDADCVLHGQIETLFWTPPNDWSALLSAESLATVPRQVYTLLLVAVASALFVGLLYKELRIASFDPELSATQGIPPMLVHVMLMIMVAGATVAAFEAVGSILVVAMLVCPAVTARLLTDRLLPQLIVSAVVGVAVAGAGYAVGAWGPSWFGEPWALSASGMITVVSGVVLVGAVLLAPRHGVVSAALRRRALAKRMDIEDLLGLLFRAAESGAGSSPTTVVFATLGARAGATIASAEAAGLVRRSRDALALTPEGDRSAREVIRRHRLWEGYLVTEAGFAPDHVHEAAERLEHVRAGPAPIVPEHSGPLDPHGRPIP